MVHSPDPTGAVARTSSAQAGGELPSYPILLTDLPLVEAGMPVPPARSHVIGPADGDMEVPAHTYAAGASPLRLVPAPIPQAPPARPSPSKTDEPIDLRYVP